MRLLNMTVAVGILVSYALSWSNDRFPNLMAAEEKKAPAKRDKKKVKELMDKKLELSQKLLAALVINDLDKAQLHAQALQKIREDAAWIVVNTDDYKIWSREFATCNEKIIKATRDKNQDAAQLGYLELTMTCFHCHAYVRDLGDISHRKPVDLK